MVERLDAPEGTPRLGIPRDEKDPGNGQGKEDGLDEPAAQYRRGDPGAYFFAHPAQPPGHAVVPAWGQDALAPGHVPRLGHEPHDAPPLHPETCTFEGVISAWANSLVRATAAKSGHARA